MRVRRRGRPCCPVWSHLQTGPHFSSFRQMFSSYSLPLQYLPDSIDVRPACVGRRLRSMPEERVGNSDQSSKSHKNRLPFAKDFRSKLRLTYSMLSLTD